MSDDIKLPELPDFDLKGVHVDGFSIKALEDYAREAVELNRAWLPIESAPTDGSTVLLRGDGDHRIADGYWLKEAYDGNGAWVWAYIRAEPRHWMPVPGEPR